jgi:ATP phosphoribosyltransferase regulatory subunit HisZ
MRKESCVVPPKHAGTSHREKITSPDDNEADIVLTPAAHLAKIADALNPLWRTNGLPLSSTWMLEFIKLLKDECDEISERWFLA